MKTGHIIAGFVAAAWLAVPVAMVAKADKPDAVGAVQAGPLPTASRAVVTVPPAEPYTPPPTVVPFSLKDVALSVKTKEKKCFGSAGCNVVYEIKAGWSRDLEEECEVTYEVKGFEDGAQVGTLTLRPDGKYEQDNYQYGSTTSSSKKLSVQATEVSCE